MAATEIQVNLAVMAGTVGQEEMGTAEEGGGVEV